MANEGEVDYIGEVATIGCFVTALHGFVKCDRPRQGRGKLLQASTILPHSLPA